MAMPEVISPPITLRWDQLDAIAGEVLGGASYGESYQITPLPTAVRLGGEKQAGSDPTTAP